MPEAASAFFLLFVPVLFVTLLCRCVLLRSSQSLCLFGVRVNEGFCWGNELRRWPTGQRPCFHGNLAARRVQGRERTDSTPTPSLCQLEHGATSCAAGRPDSDRAFTATLLPGGSLGQFGRRSLRRLGGDRSHACPSSRRVAPRPFWPKVITTPRGRP